MYRDEFLALAHQVHQNLMKDKRIEPFINPVRKTTYPDYANVIKKPTNMRLIQSHLKLQAYKLADFEEELERIWENCCRYNQEKSTIYYWARDLQQITQEELRKMRRALIKKIFEKERVGTPQKTNLKVIFRFAHFFMKLDSEKQRRLMEAVQVVNPRAIPEGLNRIWLERLT